ncbi:MAG TPA: YfiR family protein [Candidatus Didemnitutus sp.]|nr:YfiR family protein [Candidatus Didemnitutus sp.]
MAFLKAATRSRRWIRWLGMVVTFAGWAIGTSARAETAAEYQVKAVFLFNFTHFVEWPPAAFKSPDAPLVIGIFGEDPFGRTLDDVVRGEKAGLHPLVVRRIHDPAEAADCHVLFVFRSAMSNFAAVLAAVRDHAVLTVGDGDDFARRGGMIRFVTASNKIRLRINLDAVRSAGLTVSSKLLRPADIVPAGGD